MHIIDVQNLMTSLKQEHLDNSWSIGFDNAKTRLGVCFHSRRLITISKPIALIQDESEVRDTILHEIAHALVGGRHRHNAVWRAKCREIGAKPNRCASDVAMPKGKYTITCESGCSFQKHRISPQKLAKYDNKWVVCAKHRGKLTATVN